MREEHAAALAEAARKQEAAAAEAQRLRDAVSKADAAREEVRSSWGSQLAFLLACSLSMMSWSHTACARVAMA